MNPLPYPEWMEQVHEFLEALAALRALDSVHLEEFYREHYEFYSSAFY